MKSTDARQTTPRENRRAWTRPSVTPAGTISDILQSGHGKVTVVTGDPGEPMKVPGHDK